MSLENIQSCYKRERDGRPLSVSWSVAVCPEGPGGVVTDVIFALSAGLYCPVDCTRETSENIYFFVHKVQSKELRTSRRFYEQHTEAEGATALDYY